MSIFNFTNGKAAKFLLYGGLPSLAIMAIYILCAAAFGSLEQLIDSYRRAAKQLQNTATCFKGLHSVSAACCNLTLAAKRLPRRCKSAANPLFSHFAALLWRCTALLVSYGNLISSLFLLFMKPGWYCPELRKVSNIIECVNSISCLVVFSKRGDGSYRLRGEGLASNIVSRRKFQVMIWLARCEVCLS